MKTDPIQSSQRPRSFILRLVVDAHDDLRGQISEPGSVDDNGDEWKATFVGFDLLWAMLAARLGRFGQATVSPINGDQPRE